MRQFQADAHGDAEINQRDGLRGRIHQHILAVDIFVNEMLLVDSSDDLRHLDGDE